MVLAAELMMEVHTTGEGVGGGPAAGTMLRGGGLCTILNTG